MTIKIDSDIYSNFYEYGDPLCGLRPQRSSAIRLLAAPFWIAERAHEIAESASYEQRCEFSHGYFARPLDYPERDC